MCTSSSASSPWFDSVKGGGDMSTWIGSGGTSRVARSASPAWGRDIPMQAQTDHTSYVIG